MTKHSKSAESKNEFEKCINSVYPIEESENQYNSLDIIKFVRPEENTSVSVKLSDTCVALYNFAVQLYNNEMDKDNEKKQMCGGDFSLREPILLLLFILVQV